MNLAEFTAKKSEDPVTQVGCCLVTGDGMIVGSGYNRMPKRTLLDTKFPWGKSEDITQSKYPYVIHAEMAALASCESKPGIFDAYVTLFPCSNCAKLLIESGVRTIYYTSDKYAHLPDTIASKKLLDGCGIKYIQLEDSDAEN